MVNLKKIVIVFFCMALSGCFVNHLLNYPFRLWEKITSFPIDFDSGESLVFVLDSFKTDKVFHTSTRQGPYGVDICTESYIDNYNVKWSVTMIVDSIQRTGNNTGLWWGGLSCDDHGWTVAEMYLPKNFDRNQKMTIIIRILEDKDGFLKKVKNPKLVVWAGERHF